MTTVVVYRNLLDAQRHNGKWSVLELKGRNGVGKLIRNCDAVELVNARFYVCESMRARCASGKKRTVHAWCIGELAAENFPDRRGVAITYRPRERNCFFERDSGAAVHTASRVSFHSDGTASKSED